jgi:hypothetical protein
MPEGFDQVNRYFFHTERSLGLGLDMATSIRDIPEGAAKDVRAVRFSAGRVFPGKALVGEARITTPTQPVMLMAPFNTREARFVILLTQNYIYALSATQCVEVTPLGGFIEPSLRWEAYTMMQGIDPVIVVNNGGVAAPYYWDGKTPYFTRCVSLI